MTTWIITLIALWTYPILAYYLSNWGQTNNKLKATGLVTLTVVTLTTICLTFDISTTSLEIDWILLTSYYFGMCFILWRIVRIKSIIAKVFGYILMTIVFGIGYISGTIGALGVGFVTAEFVPRVEKEIEPRLIYKETGLGNAISDNRGVRIEIYQTYKYLPFVEKRISTNEYYGFKLALYQIRETYRKDKKTIYLTLDIPDDSKDKVEWTREIRIE
jgi:hypothetical protein